MEGAYANELLPLFLGHRLSASMVIGLDDILLDCVHFLLLLLVVQLVELLLGPQQVVSRLDQKLFNILFVLSLRRMLVLTFELHLALEHGLNLQVGLLDFVS